MTCLDHDKIDFFCEEELPYLRFTTEDMFSGAL